MRLLKIVVVLFIILLNVGLNCAFALTAEERLSDPLQEEKAREIFKKIRCTVCTGESINDSNAFLAIDLRVKIRELIKDGYSQDQIFDFMVQRYGDEVLMRPPLMLSTYILWFAPIFIFLTGLFILYNFFSRREK